MRSELKRRSVDALLVTDIRNVRYLTGFTGSSAYVIVAARRAFFLTDFRYTAQARGEVKGLRILIYKDPLKAITSTLSELKVKTLAFEGGYLSYDTYLKIKKANQGVRFRSVPGLSEALREKKDPSEIRRIRASAKILDKGFGEARRRLTSGVTEKEAAFAIEFAMRREGADALAFDTIIASGARGAMPHALASKKKIKKGELVVVDMGVVLEGYNSDQTRTYSIGRPSALQKKIYGIVKEAQERAVEKIRPGVKAAAVDEAARTCIERAGYAKYFGHGTGHGVGLDVHEGPVLGPNSKDVLTQGMVVTVEPGIYLPKHFGVRIEDMALVVKDGVEVLTRTPRDLVCL